MSNNTFKADAKSIVDIAFDTKLLREDVTRDQMNKLEELIEYLMNSRMEGHVRGQEFIKSLDRIKTK